MKLFHLYPKENSIISEEYEVTKNFIVRAENESQARQIADITAEIGKPYLEDNAKLKIWLDPGQTECVELKNEGAQGVIVHHVNWG